MEDGQPAGCSLASARDHVNPGIPPPLLGRRSERAALDELVSSVRAGPSRALVLRGEAGVGKSALLDYLVSS
jgi:putative ribosome biogenesis GTPase RsgA